MAEHELDLERVICRLRALEEHGARAFTLAGGDLPLHGFVVRCGNEVRGYVNHCPHAGHPLDLLPNRFLTPDRSLILCSAHGALFEKETGRCIAGPCEGQTLRAVRVRVLGGIVMLAADADATALAAQA